MTNGLKKRLNKSHLIDKIAGAARISKTQAATVIATGIDAITNALKKGERVTLVGFGTFSTFQRKARIGRNPQTGSTFKITGKRVAKFTAGAKLKKAINK